MNKRFFLFILLSFSTVYGYSQQKVSIETSVGEIIVLLYNKTPKHKANFIRLVQENFYDSTLFHRVIKDFMIQGGDPNSKNASRYKQLGLGGPGYTVSAELVPAYIHKKGALAAARLTENNPNKRSSGSQFYIVQGRKYPRKYLPRFEEERGQKYTEKQLIEYESLGGTPHLDGQYTVFGEVIKGLDILDKIAQSKTNRADRPMVDVYIINMKLIK